MTNRSDRIQTFYTILSGDDRQDRACAPIPNSLCTNLPRNYVLNVINGAAAKLAEQVSSAKLVLPWLISAMGAPAAFVGFLLPLRQAGTLLPQLFVSGQMRRFPQRKWFWVVAGLVQVLLLLLMIGAAAVLPPVAAASCILAFLLFFSLARGVGSLAFQDVTGKTIPKGKRGRMLAARSMIGGLLTIAVGFGLNALKMEAGDKRIALLLLFCGALLWGIASLAFAGMREDAGATEGGRSAFREATQGLHLVFKKPWYFRYLVARALLLSVELSTPFYVLLAQDLLPGRAATLLFFIVAAGLAQALSSPLWGKFADFSSRRVLTLSGIIGAITGGAALAFGLLPGGYQGPHLFAAIFALLGFAEAGVLLGRKTFLIDMVDPAERTTAVAFANSVMGLVTLVFGALGIVAQFYGIRTLVAALVALAVAGAAVSRLLPEASNQGDARPENKL
jgi:hypothetical protein